MPRAQGGAQAGAQAGGWEAQCVVLAWLEQLVLLPFDLAALDSSLGADEAETDWCAARQPAARPPALSAMHRSTWGPTEASSIPSAWPYLCVKPGAAADWGVASMNVCRAERVAVLQAGRVRAAGGGPGGALLRAAGRAGRRARRGRAPAGPPARAAGHGGRAGGLWRVGGGRPGAARPRGRVSGARRARRRRAGRHRVVLPARSPVVRVFTLLRLAPV